MARGREELVALWIAAVLPACGTSEPASPSAAADVSGTTAADGTTEQDSAEATGDGPGTTSGPPEDPGSSSDPTTADTGTGEPGEPIPDGPRELVEVQTIPTVNGADFEAFSIDGEQYLAVANYYDLQTFNLDSHIYRWGGEAFTLVQALPTSGAYAFEAFDVEGEHYLAVANYYDDVSFSIDSRIYRFDGSEFVPFQAIRTQGAFDVEAFVLGNETWLAFANEVDDTAGLAYDQTSRLYRWDNGSFVEFQGLDTHGAHDISYLRVGNDDVLAVAQYYQDGFATPQNYQPPAELYRWHSSTVGFAPWTSVPGFGAFDFTPMSVDGHPMLFLCNSIDGITFDIDSVLYDVSPNGLTERQRIPTHDATAAAHFAVGGEDYLAIANAATGDNLVSSYDVDSVVYRWVDGSFTEHQRLPTTGAYDVEPFSIGTRDFLAIAASTDGVEVALDSPIYELVPP